jgi:uncharacterized repeat protein (TIGR01451 family)
MAKLNLPPEDISRATSPLQVQMEQCGNVAIVTINNPNWTTVNTSLTLSDGFYTHNQDLQLQSQGSKRYGMFILEGATTATATVAQNLKTLQLSADKAKMMCNKLDYTLVGTKANQTVVKPTQVVQAEIETGGDEADKIVYGVEQCGNLAVVTFYNPNKFTVKRKFMINGVVDYANIYPFTPKRIGYSINNQVSKIQLYINKEVLELPIDIALIKNVCVRTDIALSNQTALKFGGGETFTPQDDCTNTCPDGQTLNSDCTCSGGGGDGGCTITSCPDGQILGGSGSNCSCFTPCQPVACGSGQSYNYTSCQCENTGCTATSCGSCQEWHQNLCQCVQASGLQGCFGDTMRDPVTCGCVATPQECGDGVCTFAERNSNCSDCVCPDPGTCEYGWNYVSCTCSTPPPVTCPNNVCGAGETCSSCPQDCGACAVCGNGSVESGEGCDDGNLVSGDDCSSTCTLESAKPDFELEKAVTATEIPVGGVVNYILKMRQLNTNYTGAWTVNVQDFLPAGATVIGVNSRTGTPDYNTSTNIWSVTGSGYVFNPFQVEISVQVDGSGSKINCAEIVSSPPDYDSVANNQNPAEDDYACATINIVNDVCVGNTLTDSGFENAVNPNFTQDYKGSGAQIYTTTNNFFTTEWRTAVAGSGQPTDGIRYIDRTITGIGDPYNGNRFVSIQGTRRCIAIRNGIFTTTTTAERVCLAAAAEDNEPAPFLVEFRKGSPPSQYIRFSTVPNPNGWANLDWKIYCAVIPSGTTNIYLSTLTQKPVSIDQVCIVPVTEIDLELEKMAVTSPVQVGRTAAFSIKLTNNSTVKAMGVTVKDFLPAGFTYVSASTDGGTYDSTTGIWTIPGAMEPGENRFLILRGTAPSTPGTYTNCAQVNSANQTDKDSTPGNDSTTEDDDACAPIEVVPGPPCSINPTFSTVCNDGGTPTNAADDTFTISAFAVGINSATTYNVSGGITQNGIAYGSNTTVGTSYPTSVAPLFLTATDATTATCTANRTVVAPNCAISPVCTIRNVSTTTACNNNGTAADPTDDTFSYNIMAGGTNVGASFALIGDDNREGLTYNVNHGPFGNFPIAAGTIFFDMVDNVNGDCVRTVEVTPPAPCSTPPTGTGTLRIIKQVTTATGESTSPTDFAFTATGTGVNNFNLDVDADATLSDQQVFSGLQPGSYTISETDVAGWILTNLYCNGDTDNGTTFNFNDNQAVVDVDANENIVCYYQNTEITGCYISTPDISTVCNNNGTDSNPNDDTYTYRLTASGSNTSTTFNITGDDVRSGLSYGAQQGAFGPFLISDGSKTIRLVDGVDATCLRNGVVNAPAPCSVPPPCSLNTPTTNVVCDNKGTPNDASDDRFGYTISVGGVTLSSSYSISGGDTRSGLAYNSTQGPFGEFALGGSAITLNLRDTADSACTISTSITPPTECALPCRLNTPVMTSDCNDNGTPTNPNDDTFTYRILQTGDNVGANYAITEAGGTTRTGVAYGVLAGEYGVFPVSGGSILLTIVDGADASCNVQTFAPAPAVCSGTPTPADLRLTKTVDKPSYLIGDTLTFTVTIFNDGPGSAMGVVVRDHLPANATFVSAIPSQGTFNEATGQWLVGDLPPNTQQTLVLTFLVSSP